MYNWKSCRLNGVEITRLTLNGNLVWELLSNPDLADLYYTIVPSNFPLQDEDFDPLIETVSNLTLSDFSKLQNYMSEDTPLTDALVADKKGLLVVISKKGLPAYKIYDDVLLQKYTAQSDLWEGIPGVEEGTYDVEPTKNFEGTLFTIWVSIDGSLESGDKFIIINKE